eukprot:CAMPEP_0201549908 /NCGR_PEP_ID=MMETSP0173_2-20130828/6331_1 /ASSEMBLY_ACC=CAM_ASM_000268 /TAXON_ID=218659 /ORGANISM="Vexillifera sp., Strain DIVA3 564/2" /LENGTH=392 /DNA_ID=CAMNT_0047959743 /DNA_START=206 /DNA_END=1380 /DNA_ORIENTATION=-
MEFFEFQEASIIDIWSAEFGAVYISLEHRGYGQSQPFSSLSTNALRFISAQQALADAAYFIETMSQHERLSGRPWVIWGCSYSGSLSAWFKSKYGWLVKGAIAPSGPILAEASFPQLLNQFSLSSKQLFGDACNTPVSEATTLLSKMIERGETKQLDALFETCQPLSSTNQDEIFYFKWKLTQLVGTADQWQNPPYFLLNSTCALLMDTSKSVLERFAEATKFNWNFDPAKGPQPPSTSCYDYSFKSFLASIQNTSIQNNPNAASRTWYYQKCMAFGWFQPSLIGNDPFFPHENLEASTLIKWCSLFFSNINKTHSPDVAWTNTEFGGYQLQGNNILFTNGKLDPWHRLSWSSSNENIQNSYYEGGHCAPMTAVTSQDPPSLTATRKLISKT